MYWWYSVANLALRNFYFPAALYRLSRLSVHLSRVSAPPPSPHSGPRAPRGPLSPP